MQEFSSFVGAQPWFFVPDTGEEGGTAVVSGPDGRGVKVTETQITTGENSSFGPRVGFRVPEPFAEVGDYVAIVTQGEQIITYLFHVDEEEARKAEEARPEGVDLEVKNVTVKGRTRS
jgi:hypothetical protein